MTVLGQKKGCTGMVNYNRILQLKESDSTISLEVWESNNDTIIAISDNLFANKLNIGLTKSQVVELVNSLMESWGRRMS